VKVRDTMDMSNVTICLLTKKKIIMAIKIREGKMIGLMMTKFLTLIKFIVSITQEIKSRLVEI